MSCGENVVLCASRAVVAALLLFSGPGTVAAGPEGELAYRLEAVVRVHAEIPTDARTAAYLGTERDGAGVVIDDAGLVVTIGYLITEAMGAEVSSASTSPRGSACCAQPNHWRSSRSRSARRPRSPRKRR